MTSERVSRKVLDHKPQEQKIIDFLDIIHRPVFYLKHVLNKIIQ
jgi:hypothetical protein